MWSKRSYNLKLYPNKGKREKIDELIQFWKTEVNRKINIFWSFDKLNGQYPPKEFTKGGRLVRDASVKAWHIVKSAKRSGQTKKPVFKSDEIELNEFSAKLIDGFVTKEFDMWFNVISLEKRNRLKLPAKKFKKLNAILKKGKLSKSFKIFKRDDEFYITVFVNIPRIDKKNDKLVGIDVGLSHTVTTSDGKFFGDDLKNLRIRTKWRKYEGLSAFKQGLNRVAKELIIEYPNCDFVMEKLLFKGKHNCSKRFRRNNNNWAYSHLFHQLTSHAETEGFRVWRVNPKYTSQICPICESLGKRQGNEFTCNICNYKGHSDIVGAMNLLARVPQDVPYLRLTEIDVWQHLSTNEGGG